jgi:hypothetical protein
MKCVSSGCEHEATTRGVCGLHWVVVAVLASHEQDKKARKHRGARVAGALAGAFTGLKVGNMGLAVMGTAISIPFLIPVAVLGTLGYRAADRATK